MCSYTDGRANKESNLQFLIEEKKKTLIENKENKDNPEWTYNWSLIVTSHKCKNP